MLAELPPPDHSPAEAREAAGEILARPEYRWGDGDGTLPERVVRWIGDLFESVADWLAERLGGLFEPFGLGGGSLPGWAGWLALGGLSLLAVVPVAAAIRRRRARRPRARVAEPAGAALIASEDGTVDWAAEVARCEAAGLWAGALRARYRVLVGELAQRGLVGDLAGRTAGELVDAVRRAAPGAAPDFAAATALFEEAWYGGGRVGPAERDRLARVAEAVLARAQEPSRPAVPT